MGEEGEKPPPSPLSDDDPAYFINQLDGNISLSSSISNTSLKSESDPPNNVQVPLSIFPPRLGIGQPK